jgi:general secretion pathway protein J
VRRARSAAAPATWRHAGGFTLVEVLVALLLMAILAGLSWQALDGVLRSRDDSRLVVDRTVRLSTVLTQWEQDLQSLPETLAVPALSFDGQTLRLTRRSEGGVTLVAWAVRGGQWQRWTTVPYVRSGDLQEA